MAYTKSSDRIVRDTYLDLIHRFALRPIRNDAEHEQATQIIGELIGRRLDPGSGDYLDTLIVLVNKYEDEHHSPVSSDMTPREALRAIMDANDLSQADIGKILGAGESAVSMFLNGTRGLSKRHIKTLADRFAMNPGVFL